MWPSFHQSHITHAQLTKLDWIRDSSLKSNYELEDTIKKFQQIK